MTQVMPQTDTPARTPPVANPAQASPSSPLAVSTLAPLLVAFTPICYIWSVLITQVSIAWNNNPQYAYGWSVPLLCGYLVWNACARTNAVPAPMQELSCRNGAGRRMTLASTAILAAAWFPVRLVQEANPGWSFVSWAQALLVIAITLALLRLVLPGGRLLPVVFPISFFLVAVPWPFMFENPVVQTLTRLNTAVSIEVLAGVGIPAVQHGNLIELATGTVGIDEACSGIRSLQATLMISLFLGELYRLSVLRRILCVVAGFALAMICNLARMLLLCWVASEKGIGAIAGWHDPSGVTILMACFVGVWLSAQRLRSGNGGASAARSVIPTSPGFLLDVGSAARERVVVFLSLAAWIILSEFVVFSWYRHMEADLLPQPSWALNWPTNASGFHDVAVAKEAAAMLRYDAAKQAQWSQADSTVWQLSWFYWKPGTAAGYLAKSHNPLICMPASGYRISSLTPVHTVTVHGIQIPYRIYTFEQSPNSVHVLYTRWEDKGKTQSFATEGVSRFNRLRSVWAGRGNAGQRVISLAVWGVPDSEDPHQRLMEKLASLVSTEYMPQQ